MVLPLVSSRVSKCYLLGALNWAVLKNCWRQWWYRLSSTLVHELRGRNRSSGEFLGLMWVKSVCHFTFLKKQNAGYNPWNKHPEVYATRLLGDLLLSLVIHSSNHRVGERWESLKPTDEQLSTLLETLCHLSPHMWIICISVWKWSLLHGQEINRETPQFPRKIAVYVHAALALIMNFSMGGFLENHQA